MEKIYKLEYNGSVVYIGKTTMQLKKRKYAGYEFIPFWRECEIILIEETEVIGREHYWVNYYKELGCELYNIKDGDKGLSKSEYQKEYYIDNKEHHNSMNKKYYNDNKESIIIRHSKYYEDNREYYKEYRKKWYEKNKVKLKEKYQEKKQLKKLNESLGS